MRSIRRASRLSLCTVGLLAAAACGAVEDGPTTPYVPPVDEVLPAATGASLGTMTAYAGDLAGAWKAEYDASYARLPNSTRRDGDLGFLMRELDAAWRYAIRHRVGVYAATLPGDSVSWQAMALGYFEAPPSTAREGVAPDSLAGVLLFKTTDLSHRILLVRRGVALGSFDAETGALGHNTNALVQIIEMQGHHMWRAVLPTDAVRLAVLPTACPKPTLSIGCTQLRVDVNVDTLPPLRPDDVTTGPAPWRVAFHGTLYGVHLYWIDQPPI